MKNTIYKSVLKCSLFAMIPILFSGCNKEAAIITGVKTPEINQAEVCRVSNFTADATSAVCKPGQKIVFLPLSFGNEQLPIIFAAINCDMRFSIALTQGGVACIYMPMKSDEKPTRSEAKPKDDSGK